MSRVASLRESLKNSNAKVTKYGVVYKDSKTQLASQVVRQQNQALRKIQLGETESSQESKASPAR